MLTGNNDKVIVLVSGWLQKDYWTPFTKGLMDAGYSVANLEFSGRGFGPIEENSSYIYSQLRLLRRNFEEVIYVGHSMGGLIGRYILQSINSTVIDKYIGIAVPHGGTYSSYIASWSISGKQMHPKSAFLGYLNSLSWPDITPGMGLLASYEEIIWPQRKAFFPYGDNYVVPRSNHSSILLKKPTLELVQDWLSQYDETLI